MIGPDLQGVVGVLVVLLGVAVAVFVVFRTLVARDPFVAHLAKDDKIPVISTFLIGLTATVAASRLDAGPPIAVGIVLGLVFAVIGMIVRVTGGAIIGLIARALIVLPISVISFPAAFTTALAPSCVDEPLSWFRPVIVFAVCAVLAVGLVSLFFSTLRIGGNPVRPILAGLEAPLAFFSAFGILTFLLSPFGLAFVDLGVGGAVAAAFGVLVLMIACATAPSWVLRVGGLLIIGVNFAVYATPQALCGAPDPNEFFVVVGYAVAHLLAAFLLSWIKPQRA